MTHVFVAPHPDDVALSCGGLIADPMNGIAHADDLEGVDAEPVGFVLRVDGVDAEILFLQLMISSKDPPSKGGDHPCR